MECKQQVINRLASQIRSELQKIQVHVSGVYYNDVNKEILLFFSGGRFKRRKIRNIVGRCIPPGIRVSYMPIHSL